MTGELAFNSIREARATIYTRSDTEDCICDSQRFACRCLGWEVGAQNAKTVEVSKRRDKRVGSIKDVRRYEIAIISYTMKRQRAWKI